MEASPTSSSNFIQRVFKVLLSSSTAAVVPCKSPTFSSAEVKGIYFAARWSGDCNRFTPALTQYYTELKASGNRYEIVFVSSDFYEDSMLSHHADMPWLCLKWQDLRAIGEQLEVTHACNGVPHLVFIDPATGAFMNTKKTPVPPSVFS